MSKVRTYTALGDTFSGGKDGQEVGWLSMLRPALVPNRMGFVGRPDASPPPSGFYPARWFGLAPPPSPLFLGLFLSP